MRSVSSPRAVSMMTGTGQGLAQASAHLVAVHAGQHQVEHHEVGLLVEGEGEADGAVGLPRRLEAVPLEVAHDDLGHGRVVLDHQDAGRDVGFGAVGAGRGRRRRAPVRGAHPREATTGPGSGGGRPAHVSRVVRLSASFADRKANPGLGAATRRYVPPHARRHPPRARRGRGPARGPRRPPCRLPPDRGRQRLDRRVGRGGPRPRRRGGARAPAGLRRRLPPRPARRPRRGRVLHGRRRLDERDGPPAGSPGRSSTGGPTSCSGRGDARAGGLAAARPRGQPGAGGRDPAPDGVARCTTSARCGPPAASRCSASASTTAASAGPSRWCCGPRPRAGGSTRSRSATRRGSGARRSRGRCGARSAPSGDMAQVAGAVRVAGRSDEPAPRGGGDGQGAPGRSLQDPALPALPPEQAAAVAEAALRDTLDARAGDARRAAGRRPGRARRRLAAAGLRGRRPAGRRPRRAPRPRGRQVGGPVVVIGMDTPQVTPAAIAAVVRGVAPDRAVLAPPPTAAGGPSACTAPTVRSSTTCP